MVGLGLILQGALMLFDNTCSNRQPQPRAALLGGEKWIKQALLNFRRHAFATVADLQDNNWNIISTEQPRFLAHPQSNRAILANAVSRVLHQVNDNLLHLLRVDPNPGRA